MYVFGPGGSAPGGPFQVWKLGDVGWTTVSSTPGPPVTIGPTLAYDPNRRVAVLFGGFDGARHAPDSAVWEFDGRQWVKR